jgi:hypothetical protein
MRSGAGPLNASASQRPGLAGFFAGLGCGGVAAGDGEEEDDALVSSASSA